MRMFPKLLAICSLASASLFAADGGIAAMQDRMLSQTEKEVVSLAEAMPADKYSFAPTNGEFTGVRTFALQMAHIATVLNEFAGVMLGEKDFDSGKHENGPESLQRKDAIVKYMKGLRARS